MKTLSEILALKEDILNFVAAFGFQKENIMIYKDNREDGKANSLNLLVHQIPNTSISYKNKTYLQAILIDKLKCNVIVTDYDGINTLNKYDIDSNSRNFSDVYGLCQLYGRTSPEEITFVDYKTSDDYLDLQTKVLKHAKEFLQQKINAAEDIPINKNSQSNTFWQKETSSQPSVIDQQSLDAQVLAYLKASPTLWHQLQQAPQEWDKVQQTVKQALQGTSYNKNTIIAK